MSLFWMIGAVILAVVFAILWLLPPRPKAGDAIVVNASSIDEVDVVLIGAGAMSTTLGMLLQQLDPTLKICMLEQLDQVALESTNALNNAGTGHAGNCELNYTPDMPDGSINTTKAFQINAAFEESLQFWAYLVEQGLLPEPENFINQVPHLSFVQGKADVEFLRNRYEALKDSVAFQGIEYSEDEDVLKQWVPLMMENRRKGETIAMTRIPNGSDVNFGELARMMADNLQQQDNFDLRLLRKVTNLSQQDDRRWLIEVENIPKGTKEVLHTKFVFLGAGGGALPLLQRSGIPEGFGFGGFPVGGQWLICNNPEIVDQHCAKVYGKAAIGAPPMSVPHLDTRMIDGEQCLLFGPFAGFNTKYLKRGSYLDLIKNISFRNLIPMVAAAMQNVDLTIYLIREVLKSHSARVDSLRDFYRNADPKEWRIEHAGQRVQIIKKDPKKGGILQFGTEVVSSADGTLSALLGASPGASTSVNVMLQILEKCFAEQVNSTEWQAKLKEMIPSYGEDLLADDELFRRVRKHNVEVLKLNKTA